jgi:CrcB protein
MEPGHFPWGTFIVNMTGSALLGFLMVAIVERFPRHRMARPLLATGFVGAYTTFSTLAVEAVVLARGAHLATAVAYVLVSFAAGLPCVWAGMSAARLLLTVERRVLERQ